MEQLILMASRMVDIIELLHRRSHSAEFARILEQFLNYIKEIEPKYINHENTTQNLRKFKNKLFQIKIDQLLWEMSN